MVDFGFFDDWNPQPGVVTAWTPTAATRAAVAAAPRHPSPPSYTQREYLRTAHRSCGARARASRLCMVAFDIPAEPDMAALTWAFTAFVRRHDTFWSRFTVDSDQTVTRHVVAPEDIELTAIEHGRCDSADAIRDLVQEQVPDARSWDCFGFGVIDHGDAFTVYAAVDHLHTDGVGQALTCTDLLTLYGSALSEQAIEPDPVGGHLAYCAREHELNSALTARSPQIQRWLAVLHRNGGAMPSFPLPLGASAEPGFSRGAQVTIPLLSGAEAERFELICARDGGRFLGGLLAALALTEHELIGSERYFVLSPVNTRTEAAEAGSIGWYTNLVPIAVDLPAHARFSALVARTQRAVDEVKDLTHISPHRVLELTGPAEGIHAAPGWTAMMMSYVDVRKIAGVEMFDRINGGMFANRAAPGQVYVWFNRFPDVTTFSVLFPDTVVAHDSVERYIKTFSAIVEAVVAEGDVVGGLEG
ncbi:condensation domain-containing protein [Nocardia cyriacigeorgica]|uniref:condensation domain-containing protein n=1 Tax=Nocardia cyriacigeorgica TaxID=135487 RepID=UPI002455B7BA|nr:condensation domain-containing protein [Nocardia cyriacigeorgica]